MAVPSQQPATVCGQRFGKLDQKSNTLVQGITYHFRLPTVISAWIAHYPTDLDNADDIAQHAICVAVHVLSKRRSPFVGDQSYWYFLRKIALRRFWKTVSASLLVASAALPTGARQNV